jgi:uncharacterized protein YcsI (UPF0317 family)
MNEFAYKTPSELRLLFRNNSLAKSTAGMSLGYIQLNLVMLPEKYASAFKEFCSKNKEACPLFEITSPGVYSLNKMAQDCDLRTDLPKYCVYEKGELIEEPQDVLKWYRKDLVSFLFGGAYSFDEALIEEGIFPQYIEENNNVSVFKTNIKCQSVEHFTGNLVVSMVPIAEKNLEKILKITNNYNFAHGKPVHIGEPGKIGIKDITKPDYGDSMILKADEIPVFWPCGVTAQSVIAQAKIDLAITHSSGCMLISDMKSNDLLEFTKNTDTALYMHYKNI